MGCSKMSDGRNKGKEVLEKLKVLEREIKELKKQIAEGTGSSVDPEIQQDVEQNTANIATNTANIATNTAAIDTKQNELTNGTSGDGIIMDGDKAKLNLLNTSVLPKVSNPNPLGLDSLNRLQLNYNTSHFAYDSPGLGLYIKNNSLNPGLFNIPITLGAGLKGGTNNIFEVNPDDNTIEINGSGQVAVKDGQFVTPGDDLTTGNLSVSGQFTNSGGQTIKAFNGSIDGIHRLLFRSDQHLATGIYYLYPGLFFWRMFNSQRLGEMAHYDEPSSSRHCCTVRYRFQRNGTSLVGKKEHLQDNVWSNSQYYPPANGIDQSTHNVNFVSNTYVAQHSAGGGNSNRVEFNYTDSYLPLQGFLWHVGIIDLGYSAYGVKDRYMVEITKRMDDMIEMWVNNKYIGGGSHSTGSGDFRKRIICVVGKYLYFDAMYVDQGGERNYFLQFKVRDGWNMS